MTLRLVLYELDITFSTTLERNSHWRPCFAPQALLTGSFHIVITVEKEFSAYYGNGSVLGVTRVVDPARLNEVRKRENTAAQGLRKAYDKFAGMNKAS